MQTISFERESFEKSPVIHLMPCKIMHNGKANVESYFSRSILASSSVENPDGVKTEESQVCVENAFRGRPLNGVHLELPAGTKGLLVDAVKIKDGADTAAKRHEIKGSFSKLYAWQLNEPTLTPATEPFAKALNDWISVSSIIHSD